MNILLEVPPDIESRLRESVARQDAEAVRRLLTEAVSAAVTLLLRDSALQNSANYTGQSRDEMTEMEFEMLVEELVQTPHPLPELSDTAVSRTGIYAEHP